VALTDRREVRWVDDAREFDALLSAIDRADVLALDTEQDAFFAYRPKICLLQINVDGTDFVVDPFAIKDLSPLRDPLADPSKVKIFHAAENDIALMKRDHDLPIRGLFDTMSASSVLGYKRTGLAALVEEHFGLVIEKKYQRSDWRKRPLEPGQIEYAALDVRHLDELRGILTRELEQLSRSDEAASDFARIERVAHEMRPFDPDAYYAIQGARALDGPGRRVLRDLYVFRDRLAREDDRAPYRVCSDSALLALARGQPTHPHDLRSYSGLPDRLLQRHARTLVEMVRAALDAGDLAPPPPPPKEHSPLDDESRALFDRLRDWRKKRAVERDVDAGRVVPNALLLAVIRAGARTADELAAAGFEPWRLREYGDDVLAILNRPPKKG
jgi:ribonuclease D